ncbi:carbohydrate sulfotransferase 13-like [Homarus americanus]|uniref:Carbohydrate sulfotransferase n=1 Tax=Homarus americanus TaxID=6706 RepID=A0A8J5JER6_HOMAM|nr:carbohydrate sulfotransferase 13-like [Homarus americanus]KAG7154285.1 Carbohydrate sulfotransferase 13-like 4 [Homarus americanus]
MLNRKLKFMLGFTACAAIVYIQININGRLTKHRQSVETKNIKYELEDTLSPNTTSFQDLFLAWDDEEAEQTTGVITSTRETSIPNTYIVILHDKAEKGPKSSNSSSLLPSPKGINRRTNVVFPSVTNCTMKPKTKKGHLYSTSDVYPCRKSTPPDPEDPFWPVVLTPSYGKVLSDSVLHHEDSEVKELLTEQLKVQEERVRLMTQTCLKHKELSVRQDLTLVWDTSRSPPLIYCPIYKVASTTWMVYFLRLRHINDDNPALARFSRKEKEKRKYMPRYGGGHRRVFQEYIPPELSREKSQVFRKAIRFLVVRHPLTRLLSAYRDKIERPEPLPFTPYFKHLQHYIIQKYRPPESNLTNTTPTFSEFVDFIIDSTKDLKTALDWQRNVVCWTPYWAQCGVCSSDYQVVIKLETMATDEQFLAYVADLKEIQNVYEWRNLRNSKATAATSLSQYYKSLTKKQINLLYQRYKPDFHLFGYSIDEYLQFVEQ